MAEFSCDVSVADFDEKVIAASRRCPVVVDFWAPWCQPCRILKPILEKLAAEYGGRFILAKVNSDENQPLAQRYGVRGIPAVKAFVDGQPAGEFTGALPEPKVREFINGLIPSPAEPLRLAAREARADGEIEVARRLLDDALELDPKNEAVRLDHIETSLALGDHQAAARLLESADEWTRDHDRVAALRAHLQLAQSGTVADAGLLENLLAAQPDDHVTRLQLANALALRQDYRGALGQLLELVRRDRKWQDEAGRKAMLNLFSLLAGQPQHEDLVREFRIALARTLN